MCRQLRVGLGIMFYTHCGHPVLYYCMFYEGFQQHIGEKVAETRGPEITWCTFTLKIQAQFVSFDILDRGEFNHFCAVVTTALLLQSNLMDVWQ